MQVSDLLNELKNGFYQHRTTFCESKPLLCSGEYNLLTLNSFSFTVYVGLAILILGLIRIESLQFTRSIRTFALSVAVSTLFNCLSIFFKLYPTGDLSLITGPNAMHFYVALALFFLSLALVWMYSYSPMTLSDIALGCMYLVFYAQLSADKIDSIVTHILEYNGIHGLDLTIDTIRIAPMIVYIIAIFMHYLIQGK